MTMKRNFKELLHASFKSEDTEEWLDVHFTRPVGLAFALFWERLHVHPNAITVMSIFLGLGAGYMFYFTDVWHNVAGIALLMLANFCDSTDGQLARLTGQKTLVGRVLDGFSGDLWFFAIYLAIALRLWPQLIPFTSVHWGPLGILLCAVAGFLCHSPQSSLADYYRQIHLYFLLGKKGSELDDSASQRAIYDSLPRKGAFWAHKFYYNYANYCRSQERRTPAFQQFYKCLRARYQSVEDMPRQLRDDFRRGSRPLMKYANLLTFNSRAILIYVTCLLNVPYVYPLVEIVVFTAMYRYMRSRHEQLCLGLSHRYC